MKPRDLAIVAAVVLLGGFALADALRSSGDDSTAPATQSVPARRDGPEPQADAPEDWPAGRLQGTLVLTDAEDCRIRVIGLGGGRERPAGDLVGFCREWVAPIGQRLAYSTGGVRGSAGESFAVVDLRRAGVELGSFLNLGGDVLWSPDAQRIAWCTPNGAGQEFEIGTERPRSLERCPIAYSPDGSLVFAQGRRLISEGRTLVRERGPVAQAAWAADGSSLLVVSGAGVVRRYDESGLTDSLDLFTDAPLVPSPDNCAVAFFDAGRIRFENLGCYAGPPSGAYIGLDAAWSPDGHWLAVAGVDEIVFQQLVGGDDRIVWPARARELYWRG
jgi:hypothetical protein